LQHKNPQRRQKSDPEKIVWITNSTKMAQKNAVRLRNITGWGLRKKQKWESVASCWGCFLRKEWGKY